MEPFIFALHSKLPGLHFRRDGDTVLVIFNSVRVRCSFSSTGVCIDEDRPRPFPEAVSTALTRLQDEPPIFCFSNEVLMCIIDAVAQDIDSLCRLACSCRRLHDLCQKKIPGYLEELAAIGLPPEWDKVTKHCLTDLRNLLQRGRKLPHFKGCRVIVPTKLGKQLYCFFNTNNWVTPEVVELPDGAYQTKGSHVLYRSVKTAKWIGESHRATSNLLRVPQTRLFFEGDHPVACSPLLLTIYTLQPWVHYLYWSFNRLMPVTNKSALAEWFHQRTGGPCAVHVLKKKPYWVVHDVWHTFHQVVPLPYLDPTDARVQQYQWREQQKAKLADIARLAQQTFNLTEQRVKRLQQEIQDDSNYSDAQKRRKLEKDIWGTHPNTTQ